MQLRKDARVIEWTGLEIRRTLLVYRGFESHSFRTIKQKDASSLLERIFLFYGARTPAAA